MKLRKGELSIAMTKTLAYLVMYPRTQTQTNLEIKAEWNRIIYLLEHYMVYQN